MKTVKHKSSGKYGIAFTSEDSGFADLYMDTLHNVQNSKKGTYEAPHMKLLLDLIESFRGYSKDTSVVIIDIKEEDQDIDRIAEDTFEKDYEEVERMTAYSWDKIIKPKYKVKKWYYGDRELDLFEFWLSYFWDKRELGK